jgi:enoyl-CoA hydratase/carnithine racemase
VRLNSGGGDVFAAVAIFTRLKEHPANITVIVDGWAASAATIIAMAGNTVKIPAAASFMIHDPSLGLLGYYGSDDLQTFVNELNVCKDCIINAYMTKSSKTKEEIAELMSAETWYTGEQAGEEGFCDEVLFAGEDTKPTATDFIYDGMPKALTSGAPPKDNKPNQEERKLEIKTTQELRAAYPDLVKQVGTEAANADLTRIKDIEDRTQEGFEALSAIAKYEKPQSASDFALNIIAEMKKQGGDYLNNRQEDADESGANGIEAPPLPANAAIKGGKRDAVDEAIDRLEKANGGNK